MAPDWDLWVFFFNSYSIKDQGFEIFLAGIAVIIMIFGYAFHSIIGAIVNVMGGPSSSEALICGVAVIPIALCLGTIGFILLFIWEKRAEKKLADAQQNYKEE